MCLPLLDAMEPLVALAAPTQGGPGGPQFKKRAPVRMAILYMPNGVNPNAWTPKGAGTNWEMSPILAPLADLKSELLVLSQLMNKSSIQGDGHYVATGITSRSRPS
jgi:hypothetical protein